MTPVTLTQDQFMNARIKCGCARSSHGWSMDVSACIEWQEGKLYVMCNHCGRHEFAPMEEEE